jgi:hypothetical protein
MLELIDDLPPGILGVRATGTVSRDDYERVVLPRLDEARRRDQRLRFLYHLGPQFGGFTPGGAWEDFRVGLQYLRLFERCAVVTDVEWVRAAARGTALLMPCPVKAFGNGALAEAIAWLQATHESALTFRMLPERGVLLVEPRGTLRASDFDALDAAADTWIESGEGSLRGVVVHARQFPGWDNLGSLLRHVRFVRDHHRKVRRVALAADGAMAQIAPALVDHFVQAELKQFGADDLEAAIVWAGARAPHAGGAA